jgi:hypothetical protein
LTKLNQLELRVKKHLLSILFLVATLGAWTSATAAPIVLTGSTYSVYIAGNESGNAFLGVTQFDNLAASAQRGDLLLTLSESETALSAGQSRIRISISANGDLFPILDEAAILAIGVDGDGLDLLTQVSLDDARITFYDALGQVLVSSDNLADQVASPQPWDGFFPAPANAFGIGDVGGSGASMITFDFIVTQLGGEVPEPGTVFLGLIGLAGAYAARRRPRQTLPAYNG